MLYSQIAKIILPITIIALIGFIFGKLKKTECKSMADFIIYIASPALAITQLSMQRITIPEIFSISMSAAFIILGLGTIAWLLFKITKTSVPNGIYLPIMFMNSGYLGYPLVLFAFGAEGLSKAIIFNMTNAILVFSVGIYIINRGKDRWQFLKVPFIYAAVLGMLLSLTGQRLPSFIYSPLYLLGATTIPLAIFMLGSSLAKTKINSLKLPLLASVLRIGLGFCLGLLAVFLFRLQGVTADMVILLSSLASGLMPIAISEEYDRDSNLIASTIALSTLMSVVSIIFILKWLTI